MSSTRLPLHTHRWFRVLTVWLLGPWLARPLLAHWHRMCLARIRRLEWDVIDKPRMLERNRQVQQNKVGAILLYPNRYRQ